MIPTLKPISPLRQRMLDDMAMRKLNRHTQAGYVRAVYGALTFMQPQLHAASWRASCGLRAAAYGS